MSLEIHLTQTGIAQMGQDRDTLEPFLPSSPWQICVQHWGQQLCGLQISACRARCNALLVPALGDAPQNLTIEL